MYHVDDRSREILEEASRIAQQIADEEWARGNTRYALEAYEACDTHPSIIFDLAKKLQAAENLVLEWIEGRWALDALPRSEKCDSRKNLDVFEYCLNIDCPRCAGKRGFNNRYASQLYKVLGWKWAELTRLEKIRIFSGYGYSYSTDKDPPPGTRSVVDWRAQRVLDPTGKGDWALALTFYRSAIVACLKLVLRSGTPNSFAR